MIKSIIKFFIEFLHFNREKRLRAILISENFLFGAPINNEKLQQCIKQNAKLARKITIKTLGIRIQLKTIKAVKPAKKFLIMSTDQASVKNAKHCIESAKQYQEDHNLEIIPTMNESELQNFFINNELSWHCRPTLKKNFIFCLQTKLALHFKAWLHCIELGNPVLVLEDYVKFCTSIPALKFKHVISLYTRREPYIAYTISRFQTKERFYTTDVLDCLSCYAIKPEGAQRLINMVRQNLTSPEKLNHLICKKDVHIIYYPLFTNLDNEKPLITPIPTQKEIWGNYKTSSQ